MAGGKRGRRGKRSAANRSTSRARGGTPRSRAALAQPIEADVTSLAIGGDGLAKTDLGDVFVPGAYPGDRVRVTQITRRGKRRIADGVELLQRGPDRREPPCPYAAACGGCPWMGMSPKAQAEARLSTVAEALRRAEITDVVAEASRPDGSSELGYRTRARLTLSRGRLGYRRPRAKDLVEVERCLVLHPTLDSLLPELRTRLGEVVRGSAEVHLDLGVDLGVVTLHSERAQPDEVYAALRSWVDGGGIAGAALYAAGATEPAVFGDAAPAWRAGGQWLYGSPAGFVQANRRVNAAMVDLVVSWVHGGERDVGRKMRILELYSGSGNFTVPIALHPSQPHVTAIETHVGAVEACRENASRHGATVHVIQSDAAKVLEVARGRYDVIVMDPPRSGALEAVSAIAAGSLRSDRVVMVSCDPRTLSRDLRELLSAGFTAEEVRAFDMFPNTPHVETVVLLTR